MSGKKSTRDKIKEGIGNLNAVGFRGDEEFVPGDLGSSLFADRRSKGEIIRDRLIESNRAADGWYIALDKDKGGNDWEYKDKITDFDNWTNLRVEITNWVRERTKLELQKSGRIFHYGSGKYRVTFLNHNGNRDDAAVEIIPVDAQESFLEAPKLPGSSLSAGQDIAEILRATHSAQVNPTDVLKMQIEATQKGMEIASNKEAKSENSSMEMMKMFMLMMQGMSQSNAQIIAAIAGKPIPQQTDPTAFLNNTLQTMKNLGVLPDKNQAPQQKTMLEMIQELRAMGIKVGNESDDITTQISKFKDIMSVFRGFMGGEGGDDRPPFWERLVEQHGGKLIDMVSAFAKMNGGTSPNPKPAMVRPRQAPRIASPASTAVASAQPESEPYPAVQEETITENVETVVDTEENAEMFALVGRFSKELKDAVTNDRTDKFSYIKDTIGKFTDMETADFNVKVGQYDAEWIISKILAFDGATYADPAMKQKLISYVNRFIAWVRSQGPYYAQCNKCHNFAQFESKAEFEAEQDKTCEGIEGQPHCGGILEAVY